MLLNVYVSVYDPSAACLGIKIKPGEPIPIPDQLPPVGVPFNWISVSLIHILDGKVPADTIGVGLTVMVNVVAVPVAVTPPLVKVGVTVIVATTGVVPVFTAVNTGRLPVPLAASPILDVLFVQLNTVPATAPLNATLACCEPLHTTWFATALTVGIGFTVIVNVLGVPATVKPPFEYVGVTVIVATTGAFVVFIAVKAAIVDPVPLAARPILVVLFVQAYVVVPPVLAVVKFTDRKSTV